MIMTNDMYMNMKCGYKLKRNKTNKKRL